MRVRRVLWPALCLGLLAASQGAAAGEPSRRPNGGGETRVLLSDFGSNPEDLAHLWAAWRAARGAAADGAEADPRTALTLLRQAARLGAGESRTIR